MARAFPFLWTSDKQICEWQPTTLDQIGKDESFLEDLVVREPRLLGLDAPHLGIAGPFVPFRQVSFTTPSGRVIRPDIVFLCGGGDVVVVEVKKGSNPELRDRSVIAQVVDYAGSMSALKKEAQVFALFAGGRGQASSWPELVKARFPDSVYPDELATEFLNKIRHGFLHLFIVTDKVPTGIRELIEGVASQSALGFTLSLVEIRPYLRAGDPNQVLLLPETPVRTEIINRTAVTVHVVEGAPSPAIDIRVSGAEEVEEAIVEARTGGGSRSGGRGEEHEAILRQVFPEPPYEFRPRKDGWSVWFHGRKIANLLGGALKICNQEGVAVGKGEPSVECPPKEERIGWGRETAWLTGSQEDNLRILRKYKALIEGSPGPVSDSEENGDAI